MIVDSEIGKGAIDFVLGFCRLQMRLVECLRKSIHPKDPLRLSGDERKGVLRCDGKTWRYTRHGAGVIFESPTVVVDAHVGLETAPDGIDGWRLLQYMESLGMVSMMFDGVEGVVDDMKTLNRLLEHMAHAGVLEELHLETGTRLFRPVSRSYLV